MTYDHSPAVDTDEAKPVKRGIGTVAREAILAGKSDKEALEIVLAEFPDASTSKSSIAWYRNDLRQKGHSVPAPSRVNNEALKAEREAVKAAKAAEKAATKAAEKAAAKAAKAAKKSDDEF